MNAPGHGAPKPPPEIWNEMEAAGAAGDDYRLAVARARYLTWLHEQDIEGHPDPLHGHPPTEVPDDGANYWRNVQRWGAESGQYDHGRKPGEFFDPDEEDD